jgi:hypothetical protein
MVDPVSDGGLGLDPATVAEMVGHDDGGYLIAVYTELVCALRVAVVHRGLLALRAGNQSRTGRRSQEAAVAM